MTKKQWLFFGTLCMYIAKILLHFIAVEFQRNKSDFEHVIIL